MVRRSRRVGTFQGRWRGISGSLRFSDPLEQARREIANRELSKRHLLAFVKRYEPKYQAGWFHKLLCQELMQFLQDVIDQKSPRLIITVPPRHGKSLLASQYFPAWALGNHPHLEFINTSYAQSLQMDFSRKIQEIVRTPDYQLLFDGLKITKGNEATERWSSRLPRFARGLGPSLVPAEEQETPMAALPGGVGADGRDENPFAILLRADIGRNGRGNLRS